jgi:hypothetical protein
MGWISKRLFVDSYDLFSRSCEDSLRNDSMVRLNPIDTNCIIKCDNISHKLTFWIDTYCKGGAMTDSVEFSLVYSIGQDSDPEDLFRATQNIFDAMRDQDFIQTVKRSSTGVIEAHAKGGEELAVNTLAVTIIPALIPKLVEFVSNWIKARPTHAVKFKGQIAGQMIEFEGSVADLQTLLKTINPIQGTSAQPAA